VVVDDRAVVVTVLLSPGPGLRPGMFARVDLPGPATRALVVPEAAVTRHGQLTSVFVVDGQFARLRLVRLGHSDGRAVAVVAGLVEGERIIIAPPPALRDGSAITARASAPGPVAAAPGADQ
jgi:hypothetical protein